jgi:SUMO ligase MMS21 Smc5/6 complex component
VVSRARRGAPSPAENGDDDDIEIEGEHISLKCPLTLLPFKDPVTSKKCPHSFERNAILPMIQSSEARVGGVRRGEGERAVKCPICEQVCFEFLSSCGKSR